MRKFIAALLIAATLVCLAAPALASWTGYVTSTGLYIREKPSSSAKALKCPKNGAALTILEEKGDWYYVKYGVVYGYVSKKYVSSKKTSDSSSSASSGSTKISEKTIDNYIDKGIFYGISRESLPEHGERKRKYDKVERKKAARAPQGESIEERPQEINDRQTFGHWEGDCVCGKKRTKETLFVLSERLTRNEIIIKMPDQTAASVVAALNKLERRFGKKFSQIFKSITFDNGSEFMDCAGIEKSVYGKDRKRTKVYYCHPYSAYERGTNENINKMIRRFLPKGTDFRKVTAAYIQRVETWINNYPREILGFETSGSLFERYVAEAA